MLNLRQDVPQPRIARARVEPGTTAPRGPRRRKQGARRGSEPAPEVTGLPASPLSTHARPPSSPPPGAPRENEALARPERASLEASPSGLRRLSGLRATSRLPHSPAAVATPAPPSSQAVPRGTFQATPAPLPGRPGVRSPGGAGEERELPREARSPAPGLRAPTQSARPGPRHLFPPGPRVRGSLLAAAPFLPAVQPPPPGPSGLPWALPRQTTRRRRRESKSRRRGPRGAWERARRHSPRAPGSCPGPSVAVGDRPREPAPGTSGAAAGAGGGNEWGARIPRVRPGVGLIGRSPPGSGAAPRLLAAFLAEGGRPTANGVPSGGLAAWPTHLRGARPSGRCVFCAAPTAPPSSALWARWRALPRTPPHTPTHPHPLTHTHPGAEGAPRASWAPHMCTPLGCPLPPRSREMRLLRPAKCALSAWHVPGTVLGPGNSRDQNKFLKIPALVKLTFWWRR